MHRAGSSTSPPAAPVFLAGPTAVGKSDVALLLAEMLSGEIVSVDSMQVYRGLNIGTAKPTHEERQRVPHHLVDILEISESFSAAEFVWRARRAVAEIQARGRQPVLCGGTGLYFQAYLGGLGEAPPADPALRETLAATPLPELLRELAECDPAAFEQIDKQNLRRVVRALEVIRLTGRSYSAQRAPWKTVLPRKHGSRMIGLCRAQPDLHQRINARVEQMFARGLVDETSRLLNFGLAENQTVMQAIGYRQVVEYLEGKHSLKDTIERVKVRTRQFAKRQMTWFRRQLSLDWIELPPDAQSRESAAELAARIRRDDVSGA